MVGERDYYFDNFKVFLITCVVIGHFMAPISKVNHVIDAFVLMIYMFHMPAFVFVSGYFSKRNNLLKLIKTLLIPYLFFQIFYCFYIPIIKGSDGIITKVFNPNFALWFLLSLFLWKLSIEKLVMVRGVVFLSFLASILVGFDTGIGTFASLSRTIVLLPFFILGYKFEKEKFMKFASKNWVKISALLIIIAFNVICFFICDKISLSYLVYKANYNVLGLKKLSVFVRMGTLSSAVILTGAFAVFIPRKKIRISYIGERTMPIYLLHSFVYITLRDGIGLYNFIGEGYYYIFVLLFALSLVFILSMKPFDFVIKKLMNIPIERFLIKDELSKDSLSQDTILKDSLSKDTLIKDNLSQDSLSRDILLKTNY